MLNINKEKRWVYLPCEVEHREMYHKTLLGVALAKQGFGVFIGAKNPLIQACLHDFLPRGIFLGKDATHVSLATAKALHLAGFKYLALDEEALAVYKNDQTYLTLNFSDEVLSVTERFFACTKKEFDLLQSNKISFHEKLRLTGTPKFDVYRGDMKEIYAAQAENYIQKYGKFIFIPSNFAIGDDDTFIKITRNLLEPVKDQGTFENLMDDQKTYLSNRITNAELYVRMAQRLAEYYPDTAIVFRPHQADNKEYWFNAFKNQKNIHVILEGVVAPWLLAAQLIIHNGCTTAIEASIMDIDTIAYIPSRNSVILHEPSFQVSHQIFEESALVEEVRKRLEKRFKIPSERKTKIEDILFIDKITLKEPKQYRFNYEIIVDEINNVLILPQCFSLPVWYLKQLLRKMKTVLRPAKEAPRNKNTEDLIDMSYKTKFQNTDFSYARDFVNFYASKIDPVVKKGKFTQLRKQIFLIECD